MEGPIFQITEKMKEESQKGENFIRGYYLDDDSPKVVLFTDQQWDDIASFRCNDIDGHKSILYVRRCYLSAGLVFCA